MNSLSTSLRARFLILLLICIAASAVASAQWTPISNGFPLTFGPRDTISNQYVPQPPAEVAGVHGFLKNDGTGNFTFSDGTPARFFGVTLELSAAFPDSATAVITARRMHALGINLVRFEYMDFSYDWAQVYSWLDQSTGFRTINDTQMRKFDRFFAELRKNGIYTYFELRSARAPRPEDGLGTLADSTLWVGQGFEFLYPQSLQTQKNIAAVFLNHFNVFTGMSYLNDPALAMLGISDKGSLLTAWRVGYLNYSPNSTYFSYNQSRRLDTLFAKYLTAKYKDDAGLEAAWNVAPPQAVNLVKEGSFEGDFQNDWSSASSTGVVTQILSQDSVPDGKYALTLRLRNSVTGAYLLQSVSLKYNTLYHFTMKAKCNTPAGRSVLLYPYEATTGQLAGNYTYLAIKPYWTSLEAYMLTPIRSTTQANLAFFLGDMDGDVTMDDIQLREVQPAGLQPGESLANSTVVRIPYGDDAIAKVSSRRVEDLTAFMISLEKNYMDSMKKALRASGVKQMITGSSHSGNSTFLESAVEAGMDFSMDETSWGYSTGTPPAWQILNTSLLRATYAGPVYDIASNALSNHPVMASIQQAFPNRYMAETELFLPAYASLQDWDGLMWNYWSDDLAHMNTDYVDSLKYTQLAKNPEVLALFPAMSAVYRNHWISPAVTTVNVQHSTQQALVFPRMEWAWGKYAMPGGMAGYEMAADRVQSDSLNAIYPTQSDDIALPSTGQGTVNSDTHELLWQYNEGYMTVRAPKVQAASGKINQGPILLDNLDINVLSNTETATIVWIPLDSATSLNQSLHSFLTIATRSEPTGMHWTDSTHADIWGHAPMLMEPARVKLTFKNMVHSGVDVIKAQPLDASGMPLGKALVATMEPGDTSTYNLTIDQAQTHAAWYDVTVEVQDIGEGVEDDARTGAEGRVKISALPNIVRGDGTVLLTLPGVRQNVRVRLVDALGATARELHSGASVPGQSVVPFTTVGLAPGNYFLELRTEKGERAMERVTVVR